MMTLKNMSIFEGWRNQVIFAFVKRMRLGKGLEGEQNFPRCWEWWW